MKKIVSLLVQIWHATSPQLWAATGACLLFLAVMVPSLAVGGCASTQAGLNREQKIYQVATNVVGIGQQVAPSLRQPLSSAVEFALGIATAALTAWNTHQQLAIRKLKNGNGTTTTGLSPPAAKPVLRSSTAEGGPAPAQPRA